MKNSKKIIISLVIIIIVLLLIIGALLMNKRDLKQDKNIIESKEELVEEQAGYSSK